MAMEYGNGMSEFSMSSSNPPMPASGAEAECARVRCGGMSMRASPGDAASSMLARAWGAAEVEEAGDGPTTALVASERACRGKKSAGRCLYATLPPTKATYSSSVDTAERAQ